MKPRHFITRFKQIEVLAQQSTCSRRKFGCMVIDETLNTIVIDGVNGTVPGDDNLCGGNCCLRDQKKIASGGDDSIGCDHAERSAIYRAANIGVSLSGKTLLVNGEPCIGCAKAIVRAGIAKVVYDYIGYPDSSGLQYLAKHQVETVTWQFIEDQNEKLTTQKTVV